MVFSVMRISKINTSKFGLYVGIDLWEVYTTSIVNMNITNLYSIYIGHHKTLFTYNVALPSSAFSESNCLFVNVLGMVQRTVRAVKASVNDKDMLHSPDVLLCSLSNYLLNNVKFPICHSTNNAFVSNAVAVQLLRSYFPYSVGSVSDADVCRRLISKTYCRMPGIVYVMRVRCNYMTDIVSRVTVFSMQRRSYWYMYRIQDANSRKANSNRIRLFTAPRTRCFLSNMRTNSSNLPILYRRDVSIIIYKCTYKVYACKYPWRKYASTCIAIFCGSAFLVCILKLWPHTIDICVGKLDRLFSLTAISAEELDTDSSGNGCSKVVKSTEVAEQNAANDVPVGNKATESRSKWNYVLWGACLCVFCVAALNDWMYVDMEWVETDIFDAISIKEQDENKK